MAGPDGTYRVFAADLPTLGEALERVLALTPAPAGPAERVALDAAFGRVLAEDVPAEDDVPGFDRSTVDGYAVRSADVAAAEPDRPVTLRWVGRVRMGEPARLSIGPGEAAGVATGAMLPAGADAVVMVEHTEAAPQPEPEGNAPPGAAGQGGAWVLVRRAVRPGENVLPRGSDVRAGGRVLAAGTRLAAAQIGALAAAGIVEVPVWPRPRVAVIATGDELVAAHRRPGPGQVRDANSPALAAAVRRDGGEPRLAGRVADDAPALAAALAACLPAADLILISGGSSVGTRDVTLDAVAAVGAEVALHGIALKPGKPTLVARRDGVLIFGLPGNPVSALVVYDALVRPALHRRTGVARPGSWHVERAVLATAVRRPAGREELVRVRLLDGPEGRLAEPVPGTSGMLQSLARADGYVWIPFDRQGYDAGDEVAVWRIPGD